MRKRIHALSASVRKTAKLILCSALTAIFILSVSVSSAEADSVLKITTEELSVNVGKQIRLAAEITGQTEEAQENTVLEWSSEDESIATVSRNGDVKGINPGTVQITCRLKDNSEIGASAEITVRQPVKTIRPASNNISLLLGASDSAAQGKLAVTVEPENATVKECAFSSSDEAVVTVDEEGSLQAVGPGKARITITSREEGSKVKAVCSITVGQAVSTISIPASQTLDKKQRFQIKAKILPENAIQKKLEYTSSDLSVATVTANGTVTAVGCGSAVITARATDGSDVSAECKITVVQTVKSIRLGKTSLTMPYGTTYELKPTVLPEDATNRDLRWHSSDQSVVRVVKGRLEALGPGNATVTCTAADGSNAKAAVKVRVTYSTKSGNTLSDGYPIGGPYEMRYSVENEMISGKVTVHKLTVQKLNNDYLRFTFSYNAPAGYGVSAFSPPNGEFFMVLPKRSTSSGEDTIRFEVHEDDFLASDFITIKFYGSRDQFWVFPSIDAKLKQYLKDPSSIPIPTATPKPVQKPSASGSSGSGRTIDAPFTSEIGLTASEWYATAKTRAMLTLSVSIDTIPHLSDNSSDAYTSFWLNPSWVGISKNKRQVIVAGYFSSDTSTTVLVMVYSPGTGKIEYLPAVSRPALPDATAEIMCLAAIQTNPTDKYVKNDPYEILSIIKDLQN